MRLLPTLSIPNLLLVVTLTVFLPTRVLATSSDDNNVRVFPRRTVEEAAVLEWGNSAIITALDASVALFGPQTSDAALLEVETAPVLAVPLDGLRAQAKREYTTYQEKLQQQTDETAAETSDDNDDNDTDSLDTIVEEEDEVASFQVPVVPLDNAEAVSGNLCIMTTHPGVSGVELALMAQQSGAAALLVVNVQDPTRPDDIARLRPERTDGQPDNRAASVDIPVVMISLNSAQMLATALLDPQDPASHDLARKAGFSETYMPERVRLYAGDDRPFFEDVEAARPTLYLIHDLLHTDECDRLIQQAERAGLESISENADVLQYTPDPSKYENVDRVTLWQGLWMTAAAKAVEERMEQVTSFPVAHYSDFVVDRLRVDGTSYTLPQHDVLADGVIPVASMTIFLSDFSNVQGGDVLYPNVLGADTSTKSRRRQQTSSTETKPILVQPRRGMAVIHHSTDEQGQLDPSATHQLNAVMAADDSGNAPQYVYVARKYIFLEPRSTARRVVLPLLALPGRGRLPRLVVQLHDVFVAQLGYDQGSVIFDKACVFVPMLLILWLVQYVVEKVRTHWKQQQQPSSSTKSKPDAGPPPLAKRAKRAKRD